MPYSWKTNCKKYSMKNVILEFLSKNCGIIKIDKMKVYTCCIYTPCSKIIHCVKSYDYYIIFMLDIVQCDYTRVIMKMALFGKIVHGPFCIKKAIPKRKYSKSFL